MYKRQALDCYEIISLFDDERISAGNEVAGIKRMGFADPVFDSQREVNAHAFDGRFNVADFFRITRIAEAEGRMERPACPDSTDGRFGGKVLERNPVFVCPVPFMQRCV